MGLSQSLFLLHKGVVDVKVALFTTVLRGVGGRNPTKQVLSATEFMEWLGWTCDRGQVNSPMFCCT